MMSSKAKYSPQVPPLWGTRTVGFLRLLPFLLGITVAPLMADPLIEGIQVDTYSRTPYSVRITWEVDSDVKSEIFVGRYHRPINSLARVKQARNLTTIPLPAGATEYIDYNIPSGTYYYVVISRQELENEEDFELEEDENTTEEPIVVDRKKRLLKLEPDDEGILQPEEENPPEEEKKEPEKSDEKEQGEADGQKEASSEKDPSEKESSEKQQDDQKSNQQEQARKEDPSTDKKQAESGKQEKVKKESDQKSGKEKTEKSESEAKKTADTGKSASTDQSGSETDQKESDKSPADKGESTEEGADHRHGDDYEYYDEYENEDKGEHEYYGDREYIREEERRLEILLKHTYYDGRYREAIYELYPLTKNKNTVPRLRARALFYTALSYYRMGQSKRALDLLLHPMIRKYYPRRSEFWYRQVLQDEHGLRTDGITDDRNEYDQPLP